MVFSGLLSTLSDQFNNPSDVSLQIVKLPSPTPFPTAVLMDAQAPHATEQMSTVPHDIYNEDDSRSIDSLSEDADSLFSDDMDVVGEDHSDATSGSVMAVSAKDSQAPQVGVKARVMPQVQNAGPQLTAEGIREHSAWQGFIRIIRSQHTPGSQRYMIFSDGYMWARNWREMESMSFSLDRLADTIKRSPWPINMVRSCWRQDFIKLFTYYEGAETHCIILTSSILSPDIHADILELANSLPLSDRQALFSRIKFRVIQILDDPDEPVPFNSEYLRAGFRQSLEDKGVHDVSVTTEILYASKYSWHPLKISLEILHRLSNCDNQYVPTYHELLL